MEKIYEQNQNNRNRKQIKLDGTTILSILAGLVEKNTAFMKEIEMTPPDEVVKLNLRFEGDESNGTNS